MKTFIALIVLGAALSACESDDKGAKEAAAREAEALAKAKGVAAPAKKEIPPVPGENVVPCDQLLDEVAYQTALGEKLPLGIKDITKGDAMAAASCSVTRGGKKVPLKDQAKMVKKKNHKLGILPGDDLCTVTAYCWTIESEDTVRTGCPKLPGNWRDDQSMGGYACLRTVGQGAIDAFIYRFFDEDTKCILQVSGGPSLENNDKVLACAKTARDTIGPEQIKIPGM